MIERVVTITGKELEKPANYKVRMGTSVSKLINSAGGLPDSTGKIISGGPMMGKAMSNSDAPVTKGTSGIVIMPVAESHRKPVMNCIRCSKCISVCPMGLEPYLLMIYGERQDWDEVETNRAMDCIECGSCSYTCPSNRPLLDYIRHGKSNVSRIIRSRNK